MMNSLLITLLDESGSMATKKSDVIGGFNEFIKEQKEQTTDTASAIFIKFNSEVDIVNECKPIGEVAELTESTYKPRGSTALYDAIWEGIQRGEKVEHEMDRVLCLIMTDGEENSSRKITAEGIRDLLKKKEDGGKWTFMYIGEKPERWVQLTGSHISNSSPYVHHDPRRSMRTQSHAVSNYRTSPMVQQLGLLRLESNGMPVDPPPPYSLN